MLKLLYISNIAGKKLSLSFLGSAMYASQELGYEFHSVANRSASTEEQTKADEAEFGIKLHHIDLARTPYSPKNIKAYKQLCKIIRDEQIDYIHCNTPTGGLLGRLAGKKCKVKKVIYQVHGFHFYKGAPKFNWLVYYPIEKWLAHHTDALITINQEDYELAKNKFHLRNNGKVYYVPGVGIDVSRYVVAIHAELRASLGIGKDDIMLISTGDLVERKKYKLAIEAIAKANLKNLKYCICGKGPQLDELKRYASSLGVAGQVLFLGGHSNIKDLLQAADIFLLTTKQEGMSHSMMEAMASGIPCVASRIRGNIDLLEDGVGGYLCDVDSPIEFADAIKKLAENPDLRKQLGKENLRHILEFDICKITHKMEDIYGTEYEPSENKQKGEEDNNLSDYFPVRVKKRLELGLGLDDIVLISAGRLEANKNNETTIRAVAKVPEVKLLLCGDGELKSELEALAESLEVSERIFFLGNRTDMMELYQAADVFVMMSFREGLSRSIMEAMASGLPCIVSKIRGNVDLIKDGEGGVLVEVDNIDILAEKIQQLIKNQDLQKEMSYRNLKRSKDFDIRKVKAMINKIYRKELS